MPLDISIAEYFSAPKALPLIDVRSPGEFAKGHIPEAVNIPLFSNEERAHIGTVYKQQSREKALEIGYQYVQPKLQWFLEEARKAGKGGKVTVHCWRGGMRSHAFAEHLEANDFNPVQVIEKGYKAYRNYVLEAFAKDYELRILGGYTGSGKTWILKHLSESGMQVIDLEGLAHHKGSAFGAIGNAPQPTVEQFENDLFAEWKEQDFDKPIWLEDESHNIGSVKIPLQLYYRMRESPVYFMDIPKAERAKHLVDEYAHYDNQLLEDSIRKISKRLGDLNTRLALEALEKEDHFAVAMLTLQYYDKTYLFGLQKRNPDLVHTLKLKNINHCQNAQSIKEFIARKENERHQTNSI